jgi:hypothetical protein
VKAVFTAALCSVWSITASASIIMGRDNTANRTDPGQGLPWHSVGHALAADNALDSHNGCVVYLGNRFGITAEHVPLFRAVTFDEKTVCELDPSFRPVSLPNKVDLKVFRLRAEPGVPGVPLLDPSAPDDFSSDNRVWHVGFGVGRAPDTPLDSLIVPWGGRETCAKRWSMNVLRGRETHRDTDNGSDYAYDSLFTLLGNPAGHRPGLPEHEGAITWLDSGSGLFQQRDGIWYLVGIATDVATIGSNASHFGSENPDSPDAGEKNFFVRLQTYGTEISEVMTRPQGLHIPRSLWVAGATIVIIMGLVARHRARRAMARI